MTVSVLFSEPKIPQLKKSRSEPRWKRSFSALQRAENSSIDVERVAAEIQPGFSALQRAENSSIVSRKNRQSFPVSFQCSSASRKFLNLTGRVHPHLKIAFQCSSASRKFLNPARARGAGGNSEVSVLFSEPKIPQSDKMTAFYEADGGVSVLFSEPKIPQFISVNVMVGLLNRFSALQRAENSSIGRFRQPGFLRKRFQCSSASRKFLNKAYAAQKLPLVAVSVLFSEPKIPQSKMNKANNSSIVCFSALQRAENSSIYDFCVVETRNDQFQCSSASRKFLNFIVRR